MDAAGTTARQLGCESITTVNGYCSRHPVSMLSGYNSCDNAFCRIVSKDTGYIIYFFIFIYIYFFTAHLTGTRRLPVHWAVTASQLSAITAGIQPVYYRNTVRVIMHLRTQFTLEFIERVIKNVKINGITIIHCVI